MTLNHNQITAL